MTADIIKGPWKSKRVKVPDNSVFELQQDMLFAEELCENVMVQVIYTLGENGIDITEKSFIRDMALIIEMIKSTLYRDMGYKHPLQAFTQTFVDLVIEPDNTPIGEVRLETLENFVNQFEA